MSVSKDVASKWLSGAIARATVGTACILVLRLLVQALTLLILAWTLGTSQFGAFSAIASLAMLLGTSATFGTHLVLLSEAAKDRARRYDILPYALATTLCAGCALFALYLLLGTWALRETGVPVLVLTAIGLAELAIHPMIALASVEHQAHGKIMRSQVLVTLPLVLRLPVALVTWAMQPDDPLGVFAAGYLMAGGVALRVAIWLLPEPWPRLGLWRLADGRELRQSAGYAALNLTASGPGELDKAMAVSLMPLTAVGIYAAGTRVTGALVLPVIAMLVSATPRLFREGAAEQQRKDGLTRRLGVIALGYGLVASLILWLSAPIIAAVFGTEYRTLADVLPWMAVGIPGLALRITAGSILMGHGRPWLRASFELFGLAVLILAAVILAPTFPIAGMPLAVVCSEWAMAALGWWMLGVSRKRPAPGIRPAA